MSRIWRRAATVAAGLLGLTAAGTTSALAPAQASIYPNGYVGEAGFDITSHSHAQKDMVPSLRRKGADRDHHARRWRLGHRSDLRGASAIWAWSSRVRGRTSGSWRPQA
jgi:hypothetical protein